jgi:hypothetical protein
MAAAEAGQRQHFNTLTGTLRHLVRVGGVSGLYHGVWVTLAGTVWYEGCKFGFYDLVRAKRSQVLPQEPSAAVGTGAITREMWWWWSW